MIKLQIDIRKSIINNFKTCSKDDIIESINSSLKEKEEITLPGLGVFFEILWENSNEELKECIINNIKNNLK